MRVALFNHIVAPRSPAGSCDARVLEALSPDQDFTVFAADLSVPDGTSRAVALVAIPAVSRPALAGFITFFLGGCVAYALRRLRGARYDVLHVTDCAFPDADVCYAHFCHRGFLADVWPRVRGRRSLRSVHTWASHRVRSTIEGRLVRRSRVIVVPSNGLRREISRTYPGTDHKIRVIYNTVDLARFRPPEGFDRSETRALMGTGEADTAFVFVALGHFERKGLPLLLDALASRDDALASARVWVVGGAEDLVESYRRTVKRLGLSKQVLFTGNTADVRPLLWSADAFVAPSHYEAFSLVLLEAAAAALPLVATRVSGADELLVDGVNGLELERTATSVASGLKRFIAMDEASRAEMRRAARESVEPLGPEHFDAAWRALYESLDARRSAR
jgi:glycosyltransferase involved in cell wall biosynthesis